METPNELQVVRASDGELTKVIEACMRNGAPMLVEDVGESLDPALEPLLSQYLYHPKKNSGCIEYSF